MLIIYCVVIKKVHKVACLIFANLVDFRKTHFIEFVELNALFLAAASSNRGHI